MKIYTHSALISSPGRWTGSKITSNDGLMLIGTLHVCLQVGSQGIEASWAGGVAGRQVIDRLLPLVPNLLSPRGVFYMVVIKENKPGNGSCRYTKNLNSIILFSLVFDKTPIQWGVASLISRPYTSNSGSCDRDLIWPYL